MAKYKESRPVYHTAQWKRLRQVALMREGGWCHDCLARGEIPPRRATMVHHIRPIEERPDLTYDLDNLMPLCEACHNRRHPEKGQRGGKVSVGIGSMRVEKV